MVLLWMLRGYKYVKSKIYKESEQSEDLWSSFFTKNKPKVTEENITLPSTGNICEMLWL